MISLIIHKRMMTNETLGFSISETSKNFIKWLLSGRFKTVFNGGDPKSIKVKTMYHVWGKPVFLDALNSVYALNSKTVFSKNKDIISKLFELSIEYKNLY